MCGWNDGWCACINLYIFIRILDSDYMICDSDQHSRLGCYIYNVSAIVASSLFQVFAVDSDQLALIGCYRQNVLAVLPSDVLQLNILKLKISLWMGKKFNFITKRADERIRKCVNSCQNLNIVLICCSPSFTVSLSLSHYLISLLIYVIHTTFRLLCPSFLQVFVLALGNFFVYFEPIT